MKLPKKIKLLFIFGLFFAFTANAQFLDSNTVGQIDNNLGTVQSQAGYSQGITLGGAVAYIIRGFLGLLGIIFVILIIIAGYNWMTASGDEEKIKKATSTIRSAIIGLLIIISAYAITYFVFSNLPGSGYIGGGPG